MYSVKLSWNFLGWGDLRKNSFCGRGMDISWNYIMFHANPIQKSHWIFNIIIWLCLTKTGNYQIHKFDWLSRFSHLDWHLDRNVLLTELSQSVWENLDLSRVYTPHCIQSVHMTLVKSPSCRPPAWLIRAKYFIQPSHCLPWVCLIDCAGHCIFYGIIIIVIIIIIIIIIITKL